MEFTFTFDMAAAQTPSTPAAPPAFSAFAFAPSASAEETTILHSNKTRAAAQARYRAKHKDEELEKARLRMNRLREARREQKREEAEVELRRRASSDQLRATPLFEVYRRHALTHLREEFFDDATADYARYEEDQAVDNCTPAPEACDCSGMAASKEASRGQLRLDFKHTDEREVAALHKLLAAGPVDDDDVEFLLRHARPRPTMEALSCCTRF
ncbi:hypothetical protein C8R47DRAFT_1222887 [Mycena vitilis]|nr:hypothetical protein C8R47DRAFT_1222887 [Mycena vitilis]